MLISFVMFMNDEIVIYNKETTNKKWYLTNDTVMGGVSSSSIAINKEGSVIFSGIVSTENNGGFAMVRLPINVNLNKQKLNVKLTVKGDGKQYQLRLRTTSYQRYSYVYNFKTSGVKEEIIIPLKEFYPTFRGRKLNLANFSSKNIKEVAILIGNKKNENFKLAIEKIAIQ